MVQANNMVNVTPLLKEKIRKFLLDYQCELRYRRLTNQQSSDALKLSNTIANGNCLWTGDYGAQHIGATADPTTANAFQTSTAVVLRKRNKNKNKNQSFDGINIANYRIKTNNINGEIFDWIYYFLLLKKCPIELATIIATKIANKMSEEIINDLNQSSQMMMMTNLDDNEKPMAMCNNDSIEDAKTMDTTSAVCTSHDLAKQSRESVDKCIDELSRNPENAIEMVNNYLSSNGNVNNGDDDDKSIQISTSAIKNRRLTMEDRHVIIHNLNKALNLDSTNSYSYYAIFDGHAGIDAANYSSAHLHRYLTETEEFKKGDMFAAFRMAFKETDNQFIKRLNEDYLNEKPKPSGTTAICALIENNKTVYLAWAGDSQAILVRNGCYEEIMLPHKPEMENERIRIQDQGGLVIYMDTWRVNGILSVTRAIGDPEHKSLIIADPSFSSFEIDDSLDFLVLGCDGLFDHLNGQDITSAVFEYLCKNEMNDPEVVIENVSAYLSQQAVQEGSTDNITSIVLFFKPFEQLIATGAPLKKDLPADVDNNSNVELPTTNGGHFPYTDFAELPIGSNYKLKSSPTESLDKLPDLQSSPDNLIDQCPSEPHMQEQSIEEPLKVESSNQSVAVNPVELMNQEKPVQEGSEQVMDQPPLSNQIVDDHFAQESQLLDGDIKMLNEPLIDQTKSDQQQQCLDQNNDDSIEVYIDNNEVVDDDDEDDIDDGEQQCQDEFDFVPINNNSILTEMQTANDNEEMVDEKLMMMNDNNDLNQTIDNDDHKPIIESKMMNCDELLNNENNNSNIENNPYDNTNMDNTVIFDNSLIIKNNDIDDQAELPQQQMMDAHNEIQPIDSNIENNNQSNDLNMNLMDNDSMQPSGENHEPSSDDSKLIALDDNQQQQTNNVTNDELITPVIETDTGSSSTKEFDNIIDDQSQMMNIEPDKCVTNMDVEQQLNSTLKNPFEISENDCLNRTKRFADFDDGLLIPEPISEPLPPTAPPATLESNTTTVLNDNNDNVQHVENGIINNNHISSDEYTPDLNDIVMKMEQLQMDNLQQQSISAEKSEDKVDLAVNMNQDSNELMMTKMEDLPSTEQPQSYIVTDSNVNSQHSNMIDLISEYSPIKTPSDQPSNDIDQVKDVGDIKELKETKDPEISKASEPPSVTKKTPTVAENATTINKLKSSTANVKANVPKTAPVVKKTTGTTKPTASAATAAKTTRNTTVGKPTTPTNKLTTTKPAVKTTTAPAAPKPAITATKKPLTTRPATTATSTKTVAATGAAVKPAPRAPLTSRPAAAKPSATAPKTTLRPSSTAASSAAKQVPKASTAGSTAVAARKPLSSSVSAPKTGSIRPATTASKPATNVKSSVPKPSPTEKKPSTVGVTRPPLKKAAPNTTAAAKPGTQTKAVQKIPRSPMAKSAAASGGLSNGIESAKAVPKPATSTNAKRANSEANSLKQELEEAAMAAMVASNNEAHSTLNGNGAVVDNTESAI